MDLFVWLDRVEVLAIGEVVWIKVKGLQIAPQAFPLYFDRRLRT